MRSIWKSIFVSLSIVPLIGLVVGVQLIASVVHAVIVRVIIWVHAIAPVVICRSAHGEISN